MKIVRIKTLSGYKRYTPLTTKDYRDLIFIRSDLDHQEYEEKIKILDEMLEELFPDLDKLERGYAFIELFVASVGKDTIPIVYDCPTCSESIKTLFKLTQKQLEYPTVEIGDLKITFELLENYTSDLDPELFLNSIRTIEQAGVVYDWEDIKEDEKLELLKLIDYDQFENIIEKMSPIFLKLRLKCRCMEKPKEYIYTQFLNIFELLINPDEIFNFYRINHSLVGENYNLSDILDMMPAERNFYISMVEKDKTK